MPILRDSNLWAAEVLEDIPDFPDYRPYLTTAQNMYNWVILQEVEGILAASGLAARQSSFDGTAWQHRTAR